MDRKAVEAVTLECSSATCGIKRMTLDEAAGAGDEMLEVSFREKCDMWAFLSQGEEDNNERLKIDKNREVIITGWKERLVSMNNNVILEEVLQSSGSRKTF